MFNTQKKSSKDLDPDRFFKTDHLLGDLKSRSVRGGAFTLTSQIFKFSTQTVSTLILARLLAPDDFGLIGMVTALLVLADIFKEFGISSAIIQTPTINHAQASTLFWINAAISITISLIIASLAPVIASFYEEPRLEFIVISLASVFMISGLAVQHQALLRRQMQFKLLAIAEIGASVVSMLSAIIAAFLGLGYWALIISRFIRATIFTVSTWLICSWRPGQPSKNAQIGSMLKFGANFTGFRFTNYFSRNLDNILIGKYLGSQALGIYVLAYRLLLLPIQQINAPVASVAIPSLSMLQDKPIQYAKYYHYAILLITSVGMPIVSFLFVEVDNFVLLLMGEQWSESIIIFRLLAPAAFVQTFNVATGWIYMSLGRTDKQFKQSIVISTITILCFIVGIQKGVTGIAATYGFISPILMMGSLIYCYRGTNIKIIDFMKTISLPSISSAVSAFFLFLIKHVFLDNRPPLVSLTLSIFLYIVLYISSWLLMSGKRYNIIQIFGFIKDILNKKKKRDKSQND